MRAGPLLILTCFLSACSDALAQNDEVAISVGWSTYPTRLGKSLLIDFPQVLDVDVNLAGSLRVGGRFTLNTRKYFGHELNYSYHRSIMEFGDLAKVGGHFGIHSYHYNFLAYFSPRYSSVRPFVTAGAGVLWIQREPKLGVNFGGGLKFLLTERYGLRIDVRDHVSSRLDDFRVTRDPGWIHNLEYSAGFSVVF